MPLTNYNFGVSSFGMPVLGSGGHMTTGDVYFVSSTATNASDGNLGTAPDKPLATLNGAVTRVTASQGDIVFVMPNHAENVSSSTTQVLSKAGIKWIGLGSGTDRPTFTYTATGGLFQVTGANNYIENFYFVTSTVAVVLGVSVGADHITFMNCSWDWDAVHDEFLRIMEIVDADYTRIESCEFIGLHTASTSDDLDATAAIVLTSTYHTRIVGNYIFGHWGASAILGSSSSDTDDFVGPVAPPDTTNENHDLLIAYNDIFNNLSFTTITATDGFNIDLNLPDSGMLSYNNLAGNNAQGITNLLDPGSCRVIEVYGVGQIDKFAQKPLVKALSTTGV